MSPRKQQPPPGYPVYVQYTPEDYARAMQRQKDNRQLLGCLVGFLVIAACAAVLAFSTFPT